MKKTFMGNPLFGIILAGIASYVTAILTLPSCGIWSTLPHAVVFGLLSAFFCQNRIFLYSLMSVLPILLHLLYGYSLERAIAVGVSCGVSAFFAVLAKRAILTYRVCKKDCAFKSMAIFVVCLAVLIANTHICFGNPVNALIAQSKNRNAVKDTYHETVSAHGTHYDLFTGKYLTEIRFDGSEYGKSYYFSSDFRDDYHTFVTDLLSEQATDYFERMTTLDHDSVFCSFDKVPKLSADPVWESYLPHIDYLYPVTDIVTDSADFRKIVLRMMRYFELSDSFTYHSITLVCTTGSRPYAAVITRDGLITYYNGDLAFLEETASRFPEAIRK